MAKIYERSVVTLVAATAAAASEGFLDSRDLSRTWVRPPILLKCQDEAGMFGQLVLDDLNSSEDVDPLDMRGWTLQERLLSPRTLAYGTKTLRWSCLSRSYRDSELQYSENIETSYLTRGAAAFHNISQIDDIWETIVKQYTERQLTFQDDKLMALAAVAERQPPGIAVQGNFVLHRGPEQVLTAIIQ
ncbi:hypothetical protein M7I_3022 [Glarea lozoyensis 74030]|uniref:Heterokaryon incompatibility domain-containing protein n=1 Tax=Glarea lozoyensis (strain ATCC 74030 / MF5533) TaxID=1104152 RepID=H0EKC5_GLAL7|nr:hypothetical protein M7I_3022 [Glarea lozoyensis 74030]